MTTKTKVAFSPEFLITNEYRKFKEFCHACSRDRYIGICYGVPGVGKTLSARHFSKRDLIDELLLSDPSNAARISIGERITNCRTLFYTTPVHNTPKRINEDLNRELREHGSLIVRLNQELLHKEVPQTDRHQLIIIDEADRLKMNSLEQVREIYDRKGIGIVLVGMPGMEKRLARYPQFYSRIGFAHEFQAIGKKDIDFVLEYYWQQIGIPFRALLLTPPKR